MSEELTNFFVLIGILFSLGVLGLILIGKALEKSYQEQVIISVNQGKVLKHKKDEQE